MGRKQQCSTLTLTPEQTASLEAIAYQLNYRWGDKGNVSAMLRAVADGEIGIGEFRNKIFPNRAKIKALLGKIERLI